MNNPVRLAVLGAGLIGKRHILHIKAEPEAELLTIVIIAVKKAAATGQLVQIH